MAIGMTERAPVEAALGTLGGYLRVSERPGRLPMHIWQVSGSRALDAAAELRPYLVIERRRALVDLWADADLVLRSRQWKYAHNEALFAQMRARNAERRTELPTVQSRRPAATDYDYLAGVLDGEGHVSGRRIDVHSTDPELPAWLAARFGGGAYPAQQPRGNSRATWRWARSATGCRWATRVADAMLVEKKAEALRPMQDFKRTPPEAPSAKPHPEDEAYLELRRDWNRNEAILRSGIPRARAKHLDGTKLTRS